MIAFIHSFKILENNFQSEFLTLKEVLYLFWNKLSKFILKIEERNKNMDTDHGDLGVGCISCITFKI